MVGGQLLPLQAVDRQQSPVTGVVCLLQLPQSIFYQNPVFPGQIHDVADGGHCRKLGQSQEFFPGNPRPLIEYLYQPPGHRRSAELLIGIRTVCLLRIHDHVRRRQNRGATSVRLLPVGDLVVVGDDNGHAKFFCIGDFFGCGDTVVAGDNGVNSRLLRLLYQVLIDAVAVLQAVGNHRIYPCAGSS